jgi:CHAT domain
LALAQDGDRTMVAGRSADGTPFGASGTRSSPSIDAAGLVPPFAVAALARCDSVDVLALPPLEGIARILPPEIAWRYRAADHAARVAAPVQPVRFVISDVEPPPALGLGRLHPWTGSVAPGEKLVHLRGPAATPERVLLGLAQADEIEFHTHGLVDLAVSDASLLVLSQGADGDFAVTAGAIRRQRLERAPLVLLAACESAHTAPYLHQSWSLPAAFLEAGAGAVVAASARVDDADAQGFFDQVRERIRAGASAAAAVRDARMKSGADDWKQDVIVFE